MVSSLLPGRPIPRPLEPTTPHRVTHIMRLPRRVSTPAIRLTAPAVALLFVLAAGAGRAAADPHDMHDHAGMSMSEDEMMQFSRKWDAEHPGYRATQTTVAADTFTARNFRFDTDGIGTTQVDTAYIFVGESIFWKLTLGIHTVTSGTGSLDPNVGALFDVPLDSVHPTFSYTYTSPGTFPFFCRSHELSNMIGFVVVQDVAGVVPVPGSGAGLGFTAAPAPNPTHGGVTFRFALREPGRARAEVYDAAGRRGAQVLDRDLAAGGFAASWDGRNQSGARVAPGVYYLQLRLPGYAESRRVVIER